MAELPNRAMLSGAEMVVQSLIEEGVEQIFGYPGGSVLIFTMHYISKLIKLSMYWFGTNKPPRTWRMVMLEPQERREWYWSALDLVRPIPSPVLPPRIWIPFQ